MSIPHNIYRRVDVAYFTYAMMNLLVALLLLLPIVGDAFGNFPSQVSDLLSKLGPIKPSETVDPGVALLRELGITRTTPKPFQLRPDQLPDVLSASLPVRVVEVAISFAHRCLSHERRDARFRQSFDSDVVLLPMVIKYP
jgi:hypothetical protein